MKLNFNPPNSLIESSFWYELYNKKLNLFKLDESQVMITSSFSIQDGLFTFNSTSLQHLNDDNIDFNGIKSNRGHRTFRFNGFLLNLNTLNVS